MAVISRLSELRRDEASPGTCSLRDTHMPSSDGGSAMRPMSSDPKPDVQEAQRSIPQVINGSWNFDHIFWIHVRSASSAANFNFQAGKIILGLNGLFFSLNTNENVLFVIKCY